jgi:hypothetical protein
MDYGIYFGSINHTSKWQYSGNIFIRPLVRNYYNGHTSAPYGTLWNKGDKVDNVNVTDSTDLSWVLTYKDSTTITADVPIGSRSLKLATISKAKLDDIVGVVNNDGTQIWSIVSSISSDTAKMISSDTATATITSGAKVYIMRWKTNVTKFPYRYDKSKLGIGISYPRTQLEVHSDGTETSSALSLSLGDSLAWRAAVLRSDSSLTFNRTKDYVTYNTYLKLSKNGDATFSSTTSSTSPTTGALVVAGGGSFAKNVYAADSLHTDLVSVNDTNGIKLSGAATCWMDENFGSMSLGAAASAPDPVDLNSTGILVRGFDGGATSEQLFAELEVPHDFSYSATDSLYWHFHYAATTTDTGHAVFGIDYVICNEDSVATAKVTILDTVTLDGTAWKAKQGNIGKTPGGLLKLGAQLPVRFYRLPANAADTYEHDVIVKTIGFHYPVDMLGSRLITTK